LFPYLKNVPLILNLDLLCDCDEFEQALEEQDVQDFLDVTHQFFTNLATVGMNKEEKERFNQRDKEMNKVPEDDDDSDTTSNSTL
jgi:hypothetical protein